MVDHLNRNGRNCPCYEAGQLGEVAVCSKTMCHHQAAGMGLAGVVMPACDCVGVDADLAVMEPPRAFHTEMEATVRGLVIRALTDEIERTDKSIAFYNGGGAFGGAPWQVPDVR